MSDYLTALAMHQRGLKPAAKLILYHIAEDCDLFPIPCSVVIAMMAERVECSEATARRHVAELERRGFLFRMHGHFAFMADALEAPE